MSSFTISFFPSGDPPLQEINEPRAVISSVISSSIPYAVVVPVLVTAILANKSLTFFA